MCVTFKLGNTFDSQNMILVPKNAKTTTYVLKTFFYMCGAHVRVFVLNSVEEALFLSSSAFIPQGDPWLSHQQTLCFCVCMCVFSLAVCPHQD